MARNPPLKLKAGESILQLKADAARTKKLPTPVLYLGVVSTADVPEGITSDAFKRRVLDTASVEHFLNDATLSVSYELVASADAKKLLARHWQAFQPL